MSNTPHELHEEFPEFAAKMTEMKSVNARIWEEPVVTEDGVELDAFFGYQSLANRIVLSPEEIGTTTTLCLALTEMAIAAYDS